MALGGAGVNLKLAIIVLVLLVCLFLLYSPADGVSIYP